MSQEISSGALARLQKALDLAGAAIGQASLISLTCICQTGEAEPTS